MQRRDQIGAVEHVAVRAHCEQDRRDQETADDQIELFVPRLERRALHQPAHARVGAGKDRGEREHEPRRDRTDAGEFYDAEQQDAEADESPARTRVRKHVLPLLGEPFVEELSSQACHIRNR